MAVVITAAIKRYLGLSGDTKPTTDTPAGSTFYETDTQREYVYNGSTWSARP